MLTNHARSESAATETGVALRVHVFRPPSPASVRVAPRESAAIALIAALVVLAGCSDSTPAPGRSPYRFAGVNTYFLMYETPERVDAALDAAIATGAQVVRTWAFYEVPTPGASPHGVYLQSYDSALGRPVVNHGANGLGRLDRVIRKIRDRGLRVILTLSNNWPDFGGVDQYASWLNVKEGGGQHGHKDFFTDPQIREWFRSYMREVVNHQNTTYATPIRWTDDSTILAFELGNELRCRECTGDPSVITRWAGEMSSSLRAEDPERHFLISMGDEGFLCGNPNEYTEQCAEGVDSEALSQLPNIDIVSAHLYPASWGHGSDAIEWGVHWIKRHIAVAAAVGKPFVLGEYGLPDRGARDTAYRAWTAAVHDNGGVGDLVWLVAGDPAPDPGSDPYWLRCPDARDSYGDRAVCQTLRRHARAMSESR